MENSITNEKRSEQNDDYQLAAHRICNGCKFSRPSMGATYSWIEAMGSDFTKLMLRKAYFGWAMLKQANFSNMLLDETNFERASLEGANFSKARLSYVKFPYTNLKNADFSHAFLNKVDFSAANLENANFTGATLKDCDFSRATLTNWQYKPTKAENVLINTESNLDSLVGIWMTDNRGDVTRYIEIFKDGTVLQTSGTIRGDRKNEALPASAAFIIATNNQIIIRDHARLSKPSVGRRGRLIDSNTLELNLISSQKRKSIFKRVTQARELAIYKSFRNEGYAKLAAGWHNMAILQNIVKDSATVNFHVYDAKAEYKLVEREKRYLCSILSSKISDPECRQYHF